MVATAIPQTGLKTAKPKATASSLKPSSAISGGAVAGGIFFSVLAELPEIIPTIGTDQFAPQLLKSWCTVSATTGGSVAGAAIGTMICPGVGTVVGGILGGVIGGLFGGAVGNAITTKTDEQLVGEFLSSEEGEAYKEKYQNYLELRKKADEAKKNLPSWGISGRSEAEKLDVEAKRAFAELKQVSEQYAAAKEERAQSEAVSEEENIDTARPVSDPYRYMHGSNQSIFNNGFLTYPQNSYQSNPYLYNNYSS